MIELSHDEMKTLRHWFTPEEPGALTGGPHLINTGYGHCFADRWPDPRTLLVDVAQNYLLCGDPAAVTPADLRPHIRGFVSAPPTFAPLLHAAFDPIIVWARVVYALRDKLRPQSRPSFAIRRLGWEDAHYLEALSADCRWVYKTWVTPANLATSGYAWGAFAGERLVSVACTWCLGDEYEELGVVTEPEFRGLGLNAACVSSLCEDVRTRGHTACWTTSHDNPASQRVAEKVGFSFVRNDVLYVIGMEPPQWRGASSLQPT